MTTATRRRATAGIPKKASLSERTAKRMSDLTVHAVRIVKAQAQVKSLNRDISASKAEALKLIDLLKKKSVDVTGPEGELIRVTRVQSSGDFIDEQKLKKLLGPTTWKKVTRPVLDAELLAAAVANGEVDANAVARCTETQPGTPYIKVTPQGTP